MFTDLIRHKDHEYQINESQKSNTKTSDQQNCDLQQSNQETMFWNLQFKNVQFLTQISATDCSLVWLVKDLTNSRIRAAKIFEKFLIQGSKHHHQNCQIQFLKKNRLNLGVQILEIQESEQFFLILMQNCCGGSLQQYISFFTLSQNHYTSKHLNWVKSCMFQIIQGLQEIHSLSYVHRDLKPSNILVSHQGNLKISDFGFIYKQNQIDSSFCGTLQYMAPQIIGNANKKKIICKTIDIWALGIIFFQLLTGKIPFDGYDKQEMLQLIYSGYIPFDSQIPQLAKNLIKSMLQINPKKRIQLSVLKQHQFFQRQF